MAHDTKHHHRRSTRLRGFDYTRPTAYFVTLCTHDRACLFGAIGDGSTVCAARRGLSRLAGPFLRPHHPQRTRLAHHPPVHRREPGAVGGG